MSAEVLVPQERDRLRTRLVVGVGAAGIVATVVAIVIANWVGGGAAGRATENAREATRPLPTTVGTVEQTLVHSTERGVSLRVEQRAALEKWGWADRDAGLATIPIDRAMDLVVDRARSREGRR